MKHTNFFSMVDTILSLEYQELYTAIKAHGGSYTWDIDNGETYPIIAVNVDGTAPNPCDVNITCVKISSQNVLEIHGEEKEDGNNVNFEWDDVFAGHLSSIIDYLPEIDGINDVSQKELSVTLLYSADAWHSHSSRELVGVFSSPYKLKAYLSKMKKNKRLTDEDLKMLAEHNQTQGNDTNYLIETEKVNPQYDNEK